MIVEIDYGNTRIKWRLNSAVTGVIKYATTLDELQLQLSEVSGRIRGCRVVLVRSVAGQKAALVGMLDRIFRCPVHFASTRGELGCVTNGYAEQEALGADRWLAMVAGFQLSGGPCLVIDAGTAITADYVAADGRHLGGLIAPGLAVLGKQLSQATGLATLPVQAVTGLQNSTNNCIAAGLATMLRGFVGELIVQARQELGDNYDVFVTGGDRHVLADLLPAARVVDDLVFQGLAVACPV